MIALLLVVGLPIVALKLLDWERSHRPRRVVLPDPEPHVRRVPVADRPRSLALDAWCESATGGTLVEGQTLRARRAVAVASREFGDNCLRRTGR